MSAIDVSVIIPTFHREQQLLEAIGSVLMQEGMGLEVIVVDDSAEGSARGTVQSIGDPRIRYLQRTEPSGGRPAKVRNDGARDASGRYMLFLDDDDLLHAGALAALKGALDANPNAGMAFGVVEPFGTDEEVLRHNQQYFRDARRIASRLRRPWALGAALVYRPSILITSACMVRRDAFSGVGGFDVEIPVCEDAELWSRIARATAFVFVDRPVVRYRTGAPSLMHSLVANDERLRASYRRIQGKYIEANGVLRALLMKIWVRVALR